MLDIGCGTGWAVTRVHQLLGGEGTFDGIDISHGMIERTIGNATALNSVHFEVTASDNLPFDDNGLDRCICTNSFHHCPNPIAVLKEMRRALTVGGSLFILDIAADVIPCRWINGRISAKEPEHFEF